MEEQEHCRRCQKPKGKDDDCCKCGRPSEYDPAFCDKAAEYIAKCKNVREENGALVVDLPKLEDFAKFLGVSRQTLRNWADAHPEFVDALDLITAEQKSRLIDYGLAGTYNSTIAKLVLSSDHGMRERSEQDVKVSKDGAEELAHAMLTRSADGLEPVEGGA